MFRRWRRSYRQRCQVWRAYQSSIQINCFQLVVRKLAVNWRQPGALPEQSARCHWKSEPGSERTSLSIPVDRVSSYPWPRREVSKLASRRGRSPETKCRFCCRMLHPSKPQVRSNKACPSECYSLSSLKFWRRSCHPASLSTRRSPFRQKLNWRSCAPRDCLPALSFYWVCTEKYWLI